MCTPRFLMSAHLSTCVRMHSLEGTLVERLENTLYNGAKEQRTHEGSAQGATLCYSHQRNGSRTQPPNYRL